MKNSLALSDNLIKGTFIKELKNRFLCEVEIEGKTTLCYISSSCRLSNFLDLTGREVLLKLVENSNARTAYSVFAVRYKRNFIILNTSLANRIVESDIGRRYFACIGPRKRVEHEKRIEGYKCDLFIEDTKTILEIKSIISLTERAVFPTVYSQRAIDQLEKIKDLLDLNYNVVYTFVSLNPYVKTLELSKDEPYYSLFIECKKKGMKVIGFNAEIKGSILRIKSQLSFADNNEGKE